MLRLFSIKYPYTMSSAPDLKVSLVQTHLHWNQKEENLRQLTAKLESLQDQTDLVVLPEMFTTGFSMDAAAMAESMRGPTVTWLKKQAEKINAAVTGSFICEEHGKFYNRLVWVTPDGALATYDKRHLFTLAKEHHYYTPGKERLVVSWRGWKICPLICYDLRFPVWSRNTEAYDLLIYVANWPEPRRNAWSSLLVGRAIENQSYTIGVNRVGKDGKDMNYSGDSALVDYAGEELIKLTQQENIVTARLSFEAQQVFRRKLQFLPDRDQFEILY